MSPIEYIYIINIGLKEDEKARDRQVHVRAESMEHALKKVKEYMVRDHEYVRLIHQFCEIDL